MSSFDEFLKDPTQQKALAEAMLKSVSAYMEIGIQALPAPLQEMARDETSELHAILHACAVMATTSELTASKAAFDLAESKERMASEFTKDILEKFKKG